MLVRIEWRRPEDDWPYFHLLAKCHDRLYLKGAHYPDGSALHDGNRFWAPVADVVSMELVDAGV